MINEMKFLKDLEYVRVGGSKEELKAAKYIQAELKKLNLNSRIEEFPVQSAKITKCTLEVTKPYKKKINCLGYFNSGNANLKKPLYYFRDRKSKVELEEVKGKIVLLDSMMPYWVYKDLKDNGALGFITCNGDLHDGNYDIDQKELREPLKELGQIPGVNINAKDAYEMIKNGASEVKLVLTQEEIKGVKSRNVVCDIKGEDKRTIIFTAHYDSTPLSKGVYDNATGSIGILKVAEYFATHKSKYNLTFVWCGSEERGLLGSKAYIKKHKKELDNIVLNINLDMIGSNFGNFITCVTASEKFMNYIDGYSRQIGQINRVYQGVYSSDSTPFADKGIPAISFARITSFVNEPIHCRFDDLETVNEEVLIKDIEFITKFSNTIASSVYLPLDREMPDKMKEELDYYLLRKRK